MDLIGWYVLFAVTTSLVGIYELWAPVMQQLEKEDNKHNMIEYKFISYIIFFLVNLLAAPLIILPCLIPSMGTRFKLALLASLK